MYSERDKKIWKQRLDGLYKTQPEAVQIAREILRCDEYNGWVNRETCITAMHLSSDEDLYRQTLTKIGEAGGGSAAVVVERWVKDHHTILHHEPPNRLPRNWCNLLADVGSLWRVDWEEVAAYFEGEEAGL